MEKFHEVYASVIGAIENIHSKGEVNYGESIDYRW